MGRFLKTAATYLLVGPPIGGIVAVLLASFGGDNSVGHMLGTFLVGLLFAIPLSYIFGGLQALFVGLVTAAWDKAKGLTPFYVPLAASVVAWIVAQFFTGGGSPDVSAGQAQQGALVMLAVHVAAGLGPWWLLRRIRKEGSA
jgi:hypothetical protein